MGFSLLESLIVISIIAILSAISICHFSTVFLQLQAYLLEQEIIHNLNYARALAIQSAQEVNFCLTVDNKTCSDDPAKSYMIFISHSKFRIIKQNTVKIPVLIQWHGPIGMKDVAFTPAGFAKQNGRFNFMLQKPEKWLTEVIFVSQNGRVRLSK